MGLIVNNVRIKKVVPNKGHVGFASIIINECIFLNNIAIFTRLNDKTKIRLVFPEKKVGDIRIKLFHPLKQDTYFILESAIQNKYNEL